MRFVKSKMQTTKKQHYVPQFYLKKFTNSSNEVEVLDCERRKIVAPRGTKAVCYEDFFYGIRTGKLDSVSQYLETAFQKMEDGIAKNINGVIEKILNQEQILDDEKWLIALAMSMLWIRGPVMRKEVKRMSEDVTKKINVFKFSHPNIGKWFDKYDRETGNTTSPEMREKIKKMMIEKEYSLKFSNSQHLMMFDDFQGFANLFFGQDWTVYISKSDKKFVASDNPVAVIFPKIKGFWGPTFLERTHYFPLTPEIFIVARYPMKDTGKKLRRKTLFKQNDKEILGLNMTLSGQAYRYTYAVQRQSLEDILGEVKRKKELKKSIS